MIRRQQMAGWLLAGLAIFGVAGALPISYENFTGQSECPHLGSIPACYPVLAGYLMILVSALASGVKIAWLFWAGWAIVFGMAATGTVVELSGLETCPRRGGNVPACYYSLGISTVLLILRMLSRKH